MTRKNIGACLISKEDLQEFYDNCTDGLAFRIANPKSHDSVELKVHDAVYDEGGLQLKTEPFECNVDGCSIDFENRSQNPKDFIFEHNGEFSKFSDNEPFVAYFTKGQIDMILKLKEFENVVINSYQPQFIDKITSDVRQIPNVSLMMQPFDLKESEVSGRKKDIGIATVVFGAGCPRRWLQ